MNDVFISYSRQNKAFMSRLNDALNAQGFEIWVDWEDIPKGEDWLQAIYSGIEEATKFVCIVTPAWLVSEICHQEMTHAREHNKPIIPIMHQEASLEHVGGYWLDKAWEQDARANWIALNHLNWQFFREEDDFDTALAELVEVLQSDFEHVRYHTRLLTQTRDWENAGRPTTRLLRGDDLEQAETWLVTNKDKQPFATKLMREYISASRQFADDLVKEETRRKQQIQRLRIGATIPAVIGVIATLIAIWAGIDAKEALQERAEAQVTMTAGYTELQNVQQHIDAVQTDVAEAEMTLIAMNTMAEAQAAYTEGTTYVELGKFEQAVPAFNQALELVPNYAAAYYGLGVSFEALYEDELAQSAFENALALYREENNLAGMANSLYYLAYLTDDPLAAVTMAEETIDLMIALDLGDDNIDDINELEALIREIRGYDDNYTD